MKLRFLAGMIAVLFSGQAVAIDNVTEESLRFCSPINHFAHSVMTATFNGMNSATQTILFSEDEVLRAISLAALGAVKHGEDNLEEQSVTKDNFAYDMLALCLTNYHQKESIAQHVRNYTSQQHNLHQLKRNRKN